MKIKQNYQQDIIKSKTTSLLIELSKKDLNNFDDTKGLNYSINIAKKYTIILFQIYLKQI